MSVTFRQARAILFGLSTLSLIISFILMLLVPNLDESMNNDNNIGNDDRIGVITQQQQDQEQQPQNTINRRSSSHLIIDQQEDFSNSYLPDEIQEIMIKQQMVKRQQLQQQQHQEQPNNNNNYEYDQQQQQQQTKIQQNAQEEEEKEKIQAQEQQEELKILLQQHEEEEEKIKQQQLQIQQQLQLQQQQKIENEQLAQQQQQQKQDAIVEPNTKYDANNENNVYQKINHKKHSHFSRTYIQDVNLPITTITNNNNNNQNNGGNNNNDTAKNDNNNNINNQNNQQQQQQKLQDESPMLNLFGNNNNADNNVQNQQQQQKQQQQQQQQQYVYDRSLSKPGKAIRGTPGFFVLVADGRSGADWVMETLNEHPAICSYSLEREVYTSDGHKVLLGGFPMDALLPSGMAWLDNTSILKSCSLAFVLEQVTKMVKHMATTREGIAIPRSCKEINPDNKLYPNHVLERLCHFIGRLNGNYAKSNIARTYIERFLHSDLYHPESRSVLDFGCVCQQDTKMRGLKIMSNWVEAFPLFNVTEMYGSKIIRLTRNNYLARYISVQLAVETNMWHTTTINEKEQQLRELLTSHGKFNIEIDDMIKEFHYYEEQQRMADEVALMSGSEYITIDYDECRDHTEQCFMKLLGFLNVDYRHNTQNDNPIPHSFQSTASASFADYNTGKRILEQYVSNKEVVQEIIGANGWGRFIGGSDGSNPEYTEIQYIVFGDKNKPRPSQYKGINTIYVKFNQNEDSKFSAIKSILQSLTPETIVVVSTGQAPTYVHNHIRKNADLFVLISNFRTAFDTIREKYGTSNGDDRGAVIVAADSRCCSSALTHAKPGDYFNRDGNRINRSCSIHDQYGGQHCTWAGDQQALPWQMFMKELAFDRFDASISRSASPPSSFYLDASLIAGKANDLMNLFMDVDILHREDESAVLTDFMHHDPDRIILDYEQKLFGQAFEGARHKVQIHSGCVGGGVIDFDEDEDDETSSSKLIRPLFVADRRDLACSSNSHNIGWNEEKSFPIWDNYSKNGIKFKPIIDHVDNFFVQGISLRGINKIFGPESFYIVDEGSVWISHTRHDHNRLKTFNNFIYTAHQELINYKEDNEKWSYLRSALRSSGFPFWVWNGEYKSCNYHNFGVESIPLFTSAARVDCTYAFPTPSYETIMNSKADTNSWYSVFQQFDEQYSWKTKIRKAVWRGSLSEDDPKRVFESARWRLVKMVHAHDTFDVGFTDIPNSLTREVDIDIARAGGIKSEITPMESLQKYVAVIDIDGNTASSRFSTLLCSNSVTIKVEPVYVDYFHYDLKPWKHYVPVKADLSDLIDNVAFVMDPRNDAVVREIISSANQFCVERFVSKQLIHDMLNTWDDYVHGLDIADPGWKNLWIPKKATMLSSKLYSLFQLDITI